MLAMQRGSQGGTAVAAAGKGGVGKTLLKVGAGLAGAVALVIALGEYAHPQPAGTTPDNPYGLTATDICDVYGEPIMRDFRGVLWNKSTWSRVDLKNPGPLYSCPQDTTAMTSGAGSDTAAGGYASAAQPQTAGYAAAPQPQTAGYAYAQQPQKRDLHKRELVSTILTLDDAKMRDADG